MGLASAVALSTLAMGFTVSLQLWLLPSLRRRCCQRIRSRRRLRLGPGASRLSSAKRQGRLTVVRGRGDRDSLRRQRRTRRCRKRLHCLPRKSGLRLAPSLQSSSPSPGKRLSVERRPRKARSPRPRRRSIARPGSWLHAMDRSASATSSPRRSFPQRPVVLSTTRWCSAGPGPFGLAAAVSTVVVTTCFDRLAPRRTAASSLLVMAAGVGARRCT